MPQCKADRVAVRRIKVELSGNGLSMETTLGLVNSRTGQTHGWVSSNVVTPEVAAAVRALMTAIEDAAMQQHFDGVTDDTRAVSATPVKDVVAGISEAFDSVTPKPL